jgi:hypothetical protein
MKKLMLGALAALILAAPLALAAVPANAEVARTATFTAIQPAGQVSQWDNVWTHVYTVTVQPDGTFTGTGVEDGYDQSGTSHWTETVTGSFSTNGTTTTLTAVRSDGVTWTLLNAPNDGTTVTLTETNPAVSWILEFKVTAPVYDVVPPVVVRNHGECVSGAAHAGIVGKNLAAVAKVVTLVGDYGSTTCPAVS